MNHHNADWFCIYQTNHYLQQPQKTKNAESILVLAIYADRPFSAQITKLRRSVLAEVVFFWGVHPKEPLCALWYGSTSL